MFSVVPALPLPVFYGLAFAVAFFCCHSAAQRRNLLLALAVAVAFEIGPGFSPDNQGTQKFVLRRAKRGA
jgi:hypothetical protein